MTLAQSEPKIVYRIAPSEVQATFRRRRHQPRSPPPAKIRPGSPAPATGPGTAAAPAGTLVVSRIFRTFNLAERHPALGHVVMAPLICWSLSSSMLRYLFVDHAVPAMWRSLAAARLSAD